MPGDDLALTIGELAAMVGVSTDTVRAWERRHQALTPRRTRSRHRRYDMEDVETLRQVRLNLARGLTVKLAVAAAHGLLLEDPVAEPLETPSEVTTDDTAPWRAVCDLLPTAVCILDTRGAIVDANMAFARLAGVLRPRLRGTRFVALVEPSDRAKAAQLYGARPRQRRGWELNLRTQMLSGLFTFDSHVLPTLHDAYIVLLGRDLSSSGLELWPAPSEAPDER